MRGSILTHLCPFILALLCFTYPAAAFVPPPINIAPQAAMSKLQRELLDRRLEKQDGPQQSQPSAPALSPGAMSFTPNRERTQSNLRNLIARTPDPKTRADLEQMIGAQPDLMDIIIAGTKSYGFDPYNVADVYAMWWMNTWLIANKRDDDPDNGTIAVVKQQTNAAFAASPEFAKLGDAERQEYAEWMMFQAAMLGAAFEQSKNDPKVADEIAEAANRSAQAGGVDLSLMTLTPNGFVPRKGADASGVMEDEEDTIRNARADAPAAEGESSDLGLALAAGAGLGVTLLGGLALMRRG
jgi:hypothetical protein